jgi:hypothetical protein
VRPAPACGEPCGRGRRPRALDDAVEALSEHEEELELAHGEAGAAAVGEDLELAGSDLEVGDLDGLLLSLCG